MKDSEFYTIEENWPQPPDDSCTLESVSQTEGQVKKKKSGLTKRARKKMSESLAGVTAAAIAVVMVASAIPQMKDAFDDFPELPEFIGGGEICPVCNTVDCPYYYDGCSGLVISLDSAVSYNQLGDHYNMSGFSVDDQLYEPETYPCIFLENGGRAILRIKTDFRNALPIADLREYPVVHNTDIYDPAEPAYTGKIYYGVDEKDPSQEYYVYAVMVYAADGDVPKIVPEQIMSNQPHIDFDPQEPNYRMFDFSPGSGLQMQLCSNMDLALLDELMTLMDFARFGQPHFEFALGETMILRENELIRRNYSDIEYWSTSSNYGFNVDGENEFHSLCNDFRAKEYTFYNGNQIIFNAVGWKAVFDRWRDLNEDAPETGHQVYFPVEELNSFTVNGIEYTCYIVYTAGPVDDVNNYPWIWYYLVPKQEETIAIVERQSISPETLQKLLETLDISDHIPAKEILDQITLR